jgi:hypothetical protein
MIKIFFRNSFIANGWDLEIIKLNSAFILRFSLILQNFTSYYSDINFSINNIFLQLFVLNLLELLSQFEGNFERKGLNPRHQMVPIVWLAQLSSFLVHHSLGQCTRQLSSHKAKILSQYWRKTLPFSVRDILLFSRFIKGYQILSNVLICLLNEGWETYNNSAALVDSLLLQLLSIFLIVEV